MARIEFVIMAGGDAKRCHLNRMITKKKKKIGDGWISK